ncbi:YciC family protein [Marinobacterium rhizophilum]|uniref:YciC family protein n=1 Tax=Marinobacterium rhizophilum TaxID=420402 RepID=UPI00037E0FB5|nr:YciC family protein [Marinobacterium rhizophilum]
MTFEYIRQSLFFFRRHLGTIARIQLPFIIGLNLLGLLLDSGFEANSNQMHTGTGLLMLLNLTLLPLYWGATILFLQSAVDSRPLSAFQAVALSLKYWRRLLITYLLSGFAVTLGLMLLIVPGIYAGVRLVFADYICVLEDRKPVASLRQSWAESEVYFGLLLKGLLLIFGALFLIEAPLLYLAETAGISTPPVDAFLSVVFDLMGTLVTVYGFRIYSLMRSESAAA